MSTASTPPISDPEKPVAVNHIEHIATHDKVPGHHNYYEKDGLRTYGDGEDHDHEPPVRSLPMRCLSSSNRDFADDLPSHAFLDRNGISMDRVTDSCLHLWYAYDSVALLGNF